MSPDSAPNPFNPDSLRITGDLNAVGAEKLLVRLPVRKPTRQEFFRVHVDPEFRLPCAILEIKEEREFYLVTPAALPALAEDVRHVELRLCLNRQGAPFMWPVPMPGPDGRTNSWHESAREAANLAEKSWIRMVAAMAEGSYSIYIATGTQMPQLINVPGENLKGVVHGISFLEDANTEQELDVSGHVVVIGGGNTAIDSARTALRMGADKVTIMYRRTLDAMPAEPEEIEEALEEGITIMELTTPVRFMGTKDGSVGKIECAQMELGVFDNSGRRRSVWLEGKNFELSVDMVIPAISQYADFPFIGKDEVELTSWGTFVTESDTQMTSMAGVFAGGDVARGPDEVIRAIADGKNAAKSIDEYLGGKGHLNKGEPIDIPDSLTPDDVVAHKRFNMEVMDALMRKDSFDEVKKGYHKLNAMAESMRCLHCERRQ